MVTIPRTPMPSTGFPLLLYNHGTGGDSSEVYTRGQVFADGRQDRTGGPARIVARRGWAAAGMGGHFGSEHFADYHLGIDPELNSYLAYNFLNPVAWRSNLQQMVLEEVLFRRLLNALQIDPALCPDAENDSHNPLHFNTGMEALMGQSLGSYVAGMQAAVDPDPYQGLILSGAGGSWLEFPFGPTDPVPLQYVVELFGLNFSPIEHLDVWHPVLMLTEMLVGSADNILYTDALIRHPRKSPPDILVIEGHRDHQVTDNIQRPLLMSLDVDLAGNDQGATRRDSVLWYLQIDCGQQLGLPAAGNRDVAGYGERTDIVVRYDPGDDVEQDGHYVNFQQDAPKHQYGCFLQNLAQGRVPVIVQSGGENDTCL